MNNYLMTTLYLLIPFTLYGMFIFTKWWFKKVWANPNDILIVMAMGGLNSTWAVYTLIMIHNKFPSEIMPIYALWTIFAPISLIVSFVGYFSRETRKTTMA